MQRVTGHESGQAAAELIALVPVLAVCALVLGQVALAAWAEWSAVNAARAGARAEAVGGDSERAARSAVPVPLRGRATVGARGRVSVRVEVPSVLPGLRLGPAVGRASLGGGDGG